jgi:putative aldouronate transport system permease protein
MFISAFTDDRTLIRNGYSFFPEIWSTDAFNYLWLQRVMLSKAYGVTVLMTLVGTSLSLTITTMLSYALSRRDFPHRNKLAFYVFFTMLFNGGLVPTYLLYTSYLGIKNTLLALLIPGLLMIGFHVMIMRTYFITNIPEALIESAEIDGAGKFRTFRSLVCPSLSYPILATIGLFAGDRLLEDWSHGLIYITKPSPVQHPDLAQSILNEHPVSFRQSAPVRRMSPAPWRTCRARQLEWHCSSRRYPL